MTRKKWLLLGAALLCALAAFYWPMNLGQAVPLETENYVVTWIESSIVNDGLSARPQQSTTTYDINSNSPEGKELVGILSSYSYHRCLRTLWGGGSIDGKGGLGGTLLLSGGGETEGRVKWIAQTGELGLSSPDRKYVSRLNIRMMLELGTDLLIQAQYVPDGNWETLCGLRGSGLKSFSVPVMPRRSDWLRLRFLGEGDGRIYSITRTVEQGSDRWV